MIDLEVKIGVEVEPLIRRLDKIGQDGRAETVEQLERTAEMLRDEAWILCPVETRSLQRSIRTFKREGLGPGALCSVGVSAGNGGIVNPKTGREVDYARFVEYGTSRRAAKPFLRPALATVRPQIMAMIQEAWRKALKEGDE